MCWSFQASLITWIFALIITIYLFHRKYKNDVVFACLLLVYSSMQLWEAMLWYDQKCGNMNSTGTKLAYLALYSHVLALAIGLYIEYKVVLPIYIGLLFLFAAFVFWPKSWGCSLPGGNKHLVWGFDPTFYLFSFATILGLLLIYVRPLKTALLTSLVFLISFAISFYFQIKYKTVGSYWCWICAIISFFFIIVNNK